MNEKLDKNGTIRQLMMAVVIMVGYPSYHSTFRTLMVGGSFFKSIFMQACRKLK